MTRRTPPLPFSLAALAAAAALTTACGDAEPPTAFVGATVWDGTGAAPIGNATIVVDAGRIVSVEAAGDVPAGADVVPLDGRYVIPGLVNAHGHVTGLWAADRVADERDRIRADLALYARYGVTTVASLGDGAAAVAVRDAAAPTDARARLLAAGPVVADSDPQAARAAALANADLGVDWLKLRVDDNLGTAEKMPWNAVEAVIVAGNERGLKTAAHMFYLDDAKRLLDAGAGMLAHSVRDTDIDAEFVAALRDSGVCYVPTLTRELSTFVYAERPAFFDDPFFARDAHAGELARASDPDFMARMASSPAAAAYRTALAQAMRNLATLSAAGARIAMGTDSGPSVRFPGYFEHLELELMVDAGLTPEEALASATRVAAECVGAGNVGTLTPGRFADFVVLGADPLADIAATRALESVYVAGRRVGP